MSENESIRVMVVDDITETRENLKKLLLFEKGVEVIGAAASGEEGIELGKKLRPDVVIMDINMPGIDGISAAEILSREVPGLQIIMMSVQSEADYLRRSMLAGAREFLIKPFSADELITSIRRVYELGRAQRQATRAAAAPAVAPQQAPTAGNYAPSQAAGQQPRTGKVIAVFGAKGGVGASSLACNLAVALREAQPGARVALMDGDFQFGDVGVILNMTPTQTIVDLSDSVNDLDREFLGEVMATHASGIKVLLAPPSPEMADLVQTDHIKKIVSVMRENFDYVLIDTSTSFSEPTLTMLDVAEQVVLVITTEIPAIRNAKLFFEVSEQLNYDEGKVMLVLNKYDPRGGISAEAIQASIKHAVVASINRDERTTNTAINQGVPFVVSQPRSQVSLDTINIARRLAGVAAATNNQVPAYAATPQYAQNNAPAAVAPPPPKKRSLFGRLFGR